MTVSTPTVSGQILTSAYVNNNINSGLVYIKEQTIGSGVSSVEVTGAFSADYDNYKILISGGAGSTAAELNLRFGSVVSGYYTSFIFTAWNSTVSADSSKVATRIQYIGAMASDGIQANIDVMSPFLSKATRTFAGGFGQQTAFVGSSSGALFDTTSYTAFTILAASGTMTGGTIYVYGYRKA
jgi:hypothetical protein